MTDLPEQYSTSWNEMTVILIEPQSEQDLKVQLFASGLLSVDLAESFHNSQMYCSLQHRPKYCQLTSEKLHKISNQESSESKGKNVGKKLRVMDAAEWRRIVALLSCSKI